MRIWLDLDGVLVNFRKQYKELTGECIRCRYVRGMSEEEVWDQVDMAGRDWWANLPWMDDGKELWDYLKGYDVHILTAAVDYDGCRLGKYDWVMRELGLPIERINVVDRDTKHLYSGPLELLIDDYDKNCQSWEDKGGIALQHRDAKSTIEEFKKLAEIHEIRPLTT